MKAHLKCSQCLGVSYCVFGGFCGVECWYGHGPQVSSGSYIVQVWLKIHLANLYGFDKGNFDERAAFVTNHLDDIYDSAENPLEVGRSPRLGHFF